MGRKAQFDNSQFTDAALDLLARRGPAAVTVASIADEIGAPVGSVYHRFPSREVIIAEMWLGIAGSFQRGFLAILETGDYVEASLYTPRWVRNNMREARVLLLYRRDELITGRWPEAVAQRAEALGRELNEVMRCFVGRRFGRVTRDNMARAVFALADVPLAAVRRYLENGEAPPAFVDELVQKTCEGMLGG